MCGNQMVITMVTNRLSGAYISQWLYQFLSDLNCIPSRPLEVDDLFLAAEMAVMNGYTSWLESSPAAETISMVSYLK